MANAIKKGDDISEKSYLTRQVETSISLLDSPEDYIVLEALLYLSKYADISLPNLHYLREKGLLQKLLNLFDRNICIIRIALRFLNIILNLDDVITEFDQGNYDDKIRQVTDFYINHRDYYVKEFAVNILIKLATTYRITNLIFSVDLLNPILETLQTKHSQSLKTTIKLFDVLLSAPAALSVLPELENFDVTVIINYLNDADEEISMLAFNIVSKLTLFGLDVYQEIFRRHKLVEKMLERLMDSKQKIYHDMAIAIILNCMKSDLTSSYFIESIQFLQFCQWVKTIEANDYLRPCVEIFYKLSSLPQIRQMLFDLSVEESILNFLKSSEKYILNKACQAIDNMSEHQYCCEQMLNLSVIRAISDMLERDDTYDPENAVAIKTLTNLMRRSLKTIDFLNFLSVEQIFIEMFRKGMSSFSEESYLNIVQVLYQFAVHPIHRVTIVNGKFFSELLKVVQTGTENVANLCLEMLAYLIPGADFIELFIAIHGPVIIIEKLKTTKNPQLLKSVLIFIHCTLFSESIMMEFIDQDLVTILKSFSEYVKYREPLITTILDLLYDIFLPLKFFERGRLEITDKLIHRFYMYTGKKPTSFIPPEKFKSNELSKTTTIYIVNVKPSISDTPPSKPGTNSSSRSSFSPDPFLATYIYHISQYFENESNITTKIKILAEYVDTILCATKTILRKFHTIKLHVQNLKFKLGSNIIPVGYLREGFHCEKALLFKVIADQTGIPCALIQGRGNLCWNEIALLTRKNESQVLTMYVVDLINNIGELMAKGTREANMYCNSVNY